MMKVRYAAMIMLAGGLLLPAATVVPCVEEGAPKDAADTPTQTDDSRTAEQLVCDAGASSPTASATAFGLGAGGLLSALLTGLGKSGATGSTTSTLR